MSYKCYNCNKSFEDRPFVVYHVFFDKYEFCKDCKKVTYTEEDIIQMREFVKKLKKS